MIASCMSLTIIKKCIQLWHLNFSTLDPSLLSLMSISASTVCVCGVVLRDLWYIVIIFDFINKYPPENFRKIFL